MALIERGPQRITVNLAPVRIAIGGGRVRPCARVRLRAAGMARDVADEFVELVRVAPGVLMRLGRSASAPDLVTAALAQARLGGSLHAECKIDEVVVDCVWPALA
jgi:hypothetical protein